MTIFNYKDAPVLFDEDWKTSGLTRVSTVEHGELGFMWRESNGSYSASIGDYVKRFIGNSGVAFRWLIQNQPERKVNDG